MRHKYIWTIIFIISCVFIFAGAVNAGFSRYFCAIPFMVLILVISNLKFKSRALVTFSVMYIVFSIVLSRTQERNPILFPILDGGVVTVLKDGYQETFLSDGSGGFSEDNDSDIGCSWCGDVVFTEISAGEQYDVTGIRIGNPEFGTSIAVVTDIGEFDEDDYDPIDDDATIRLNKTVHVKWAERLSMLMVWPILPSIALNDIDRYIHKTLPEWMFFLEVR